METDVTKCENMFHVANDGFTCKKLNESLGFQHSFQIKDNRHRRYCENLNQEAADIICSTFVMKMDVNKMVDRMQRLIKLSGKELARTMLREAAMSGKYEERELEDVLDLVEL